MSKSSYLKSISSYHIQLKQAWEEILELELAVGYKDVRNVIIAGMGGSSFGARVVLGAFSNDRLKIPLKLITDYDLPVYANAKTLVILTSYSGNTEEVFSVMKKASQKGCKILGITSGGKLGEVIKTGQIAGYIFDAKSNPSNAPRTGIGYIVGSTLGVLRNLEFLDVTNEDVDSLYSYIDSLIKRLVKEKDLIDKLVQKLLDKSPIFIAAEHLSCAAHIWRNFLDETAKNIGFTYEIPSMNHYFLDGLQFPPGIKEEVLFIYMFSNLYNKRINKRFQISREITKKRGFEDSVIVLDADDKLKEIFELIIIGSFVSYKIAEAYKVDPSTNEMVDYLKRQLSSF